MKNSVLCLFAIFGVFLFSCSKESQKEDIEVVNTEAINVQRRNAPPILQYQTPGFTAESSEFSENFNDDFIGVYLPYEYINSLISTRNHSLSLHSYSSKIHDVLAVIEDNIYSNGEWHDQYAILEVEGNLFQYVYDGEDTVIIDNNGYSYRKIGDDPRDYYNIARTFTAEIVLSELESKRIGAFASNGMAVFPFLYFFTGEDTFRINLDDMFFEKDLNLLLVSINPDNRFYMGILIEGDDYYFYSLKSTDNNRLAERADLIYHYNLTEDKNIILALSGLSYYVSFYYDEYIKGLTDHEKRIITNTMFALHGYSFVSDEWQSFFSKYSWYRPDEKVKNDPSILNTYQQKLLECLSQ